MFETIKLIFGVGPSTSTLTASTSSSIQPLIEQQEQPKLEPELAQTNSRSSTRLSDLHLDLDSNSNLSPEKR